MCRTDDGHQNLCSHLGPTDGYSPSQTAGYWYIWLKISEPAPVSGTFSDPFAPGLGLASCSQIKHDDNHAADGVYALAVDDVGVPTFCDMKTDGGGWSLIFSSNSIDGTLLETSLSDPAQVRRNAQRSARRCTAAMCANRRCIFQVSNVQSLHPQGPMPGIWTPFDSVSQIRFECEAHLSSAPQRKVSHVSCHDN